MQIPDFNKDEVPTEVIENVGEDFEIVPVAEEAPEYKPQVDTVRDPYLDRKLFKQVEELSLLQKAYDKNASRKDNWKRVKKVSRYIKSPLYEVRTLDKMQKVLYNRDSSVEEGINTEGDD